MRADELSMPFDEEFLADPHAGYAKLRAEAPVHRIRAPDGSPVWLVTRYADVKACLADPRLSVDKTNSRGHGYKGFELPPALDRNLMNMDAPDHTRLRKLVSKAFTPRYLAEMHERVQLVADALIDAIVPRGQADLVRSYALPLPAMVVCDMLGVPDHDREEFRGWVLDLFAPDSSEPVRAKEKLRSAVGKMQQFFVRLVAAKRKKPGPDLLSQWVLLRDEGDGLSEDELTSLAFLTVIAGYENPVNTISIGVWTLLQRPDLAADLRDEPGQLASVVDELLRHDGPLPLAVRRFPLADIEIGGVRIPTGETVMLGIMSANRDPAQFSEPDLFDVQRTDNRHLSFGHGIHYCLGAALARITAQVALGTVLRRFPDLRLADPAAAPRWRQSFRSRGLAELPVRFSPASLK
ncbi:cytochrome P450 hydroxylase [Longimycelium tulufanense]|uniref:Cytochrome P450 hydroxylase n=1 Tax=Longimycelium tulufanense TaxID=907463 RepID=A0A8J3CC86_9PSEU|nr:cytochrome P450 [Longimycelium tulufanense]GGM72884.1 cytochrome P450 hydroxylase [Longimycelium tulufanense]